MTTVSLINNQEDLWKYLQLCSESADYLVIRGRDCQPYIISESDYGDHWAQRYIGDDEPVDKYYWLVQRDGKLNPDWLDKVLPAAVLWTPGDQIIPKTEEVS
jgi:hypothetical protein